MPLPQIVVPHYELTLPTNGKKIKFRPFLVKEEKIMLLAAASKEAVDIKNTIVQIITNCIIEPEDFKVNEAAVVDIQFILINLRIRSVGKAVESEFACNAIPEGQTEPCGEPFTVSYNLEDIQVLKDPNYKPEIWLTPELGVKMKPPSFKVITFNAGGDNYILEDAIESIFDHDQSYPFKDEPIETRQAWLDDLPRIQYEKIANFLTTLPKFQVDRTHVCTKCGHTHNIKIRDFTSFF